MGATNALMPEIAKALLGEAFTNYSATNAHIGVGNNNTAFVATQTDLQATGAVRKIVDSAPTRSGSSMTFVATFLTTEANFSWLEWGVFNAATGGTMMQRKVETASALGTKTSSSEWVMSATVQLQAG